MHSTTIDARSIFPRLLVTLTATLATIPASAQQALIDTEPNDTPRTASRFGAPMTLMGTMPSGDQDAWLWNVSDEDAGHRWRLELQGLPGVLTTVDLVTLQYTDSGSVTQADRLLKLGSRDGQRPEVVDNLIFEPGEYLLGLARSDGEAPFRPVSGSITFGEPSAAESRANTAGEDSSTAYRLFISQAQRLPSGGGPRPSSADNAIDVQAERERATVFESEDPAWYRIRLSDTQASSRWNVDLQIPVGRRIEAKLQNSTGETLATVRNQPSGKARFTDVNLPPGDYYVTVTPLIAPGGTTGFVQTLLLTETGQRVAGSEAEPNDRWDLANHAGASAAGDYQFGEQSCCTGRMGSRTDKDYFHFTFSEEEVEVLHNLVLETAPDHEFELCLLDAEGAIIQCRRRSGTVAMNDLLLVAGSYGVRVEGRTEGVDYRVAFAAAGPIEAGRESEPNDTIKYAVGTPQNNRIKGAFDGKNDIDFYRFVIEDEPQLWRVQAVGQNIRAIEYRDAIGGLSQRIEAASGQRRLSMDNLFLLPGTHSFSVHSHDAGDYTLLARAIGPPDPNGELEPNDDDSRMQTLRIGQVRTGLLSNPRDIDLYKFNLAAWDHIRLVIVPPADGKLSAELYHDGMAVGAARRTDGDIVLEGLFPPGDYRLSLEPRETSDAEYSLSLERGDRFVCADDCEPNNSAVFASPFPRHHVLSGRSGDWNDLDWFSLPLSQAARDVAFVTEIRNDLRVFDSQLKQVDFAYDREANVYRGTLSAGEQHFMHIGKRSVASDYTVTMLVGDETEPPPASADLSAELQLELTTTEIAPYEQVGQRVMGELTLQNNDTAPLELQLHATTSDSRWQTALGAASIRLAPGATQTIELIVTAPPDVWADKPVRVSARAAADNGEAVTAYADLATDAEASPVNPVHAWNIPPALRGGINVARADFGSSNTAEPMPASNPATLDELYDGRAAIGFGPSFKGNRGAAQRVTVKLAGNQLVPVTGFILNPLYRDYKSRTPRDVEFQLSSDGVSFDTVMKEQLTSLGTDQHFVLDEVVSASHARLLLTTNWSGQLDGDLTLGEWKVIARAGFDPRDEAARNIADPKLGGHIVWAKPSMRGRKVSLLTVEDEKLGAQLPDDMPLEWVLGFNHGRVAKIERIGWIDRVASGSNIDELGVAVSLESPVGPWQPVAKWSRSASPGELRFDVPVWARYLKFSVAENPDRPSVNFPETLTVYEAATSGDYRSILSEWGVNSRSAYFESLQPVAIREGLAKRGNESRATADALQPGNPETGAVRLLDQSHWYRPQLPVGHNTLLLTVQGDPTVRTELELTTGQGDVVPLNKLERDSTAGRHIYEAFVEAQNDLLLEVREPPRSVMFMWDTSPSIGRYRPMVYKSLMAYAEDLVPKIDTANLLPFGAGSPLLDDWYGEPYLMQLILNDHARKEGSSAAEHANAIATQALAPRPGTKAIVTITDAETFDFPEMWDGMKEVQPRVFSMHVGPTAASQDLMQSWSNVNGGYYSHVIHENEMEIAFERAATMLRRPAKYELSLATEIQDAPGPGFLRVVSGDARAGRGAVELILDASGSMLQRMEGRRRIEIAKEVLTTAIEEQIPVGTPTALRVFGHRTPNACETDLEIPLAPLDAASAASRIAAVQAKNLARTPIAASLAAVKQDLRAVNGPALIVLVTDGEETCEGDPAAVIASLRESGMEVSLNIVGFAIDDQMLADNFAAWAEAGGGKYFVANNTETLAESVAEALATSFRVFDEHNAEVAAGRVDGEPVELKQGTYRVVLNTSPRTSLMTNIAQQETVELNADGGR
ncbi:MAG: hypothetical protein AAF417_09145 [Pseudomonadota bacterium]